MEQAAEKKFPVNAKDYKLYEEVGEGVSATVYRALCIPFNVVVAIKVLDLERCNNDLVRRLFSVKWFCYFSYSLFNCLFHSFFFLLNLFLPCP